MKFSFPTARLSRRVPPKELVSQGHPNLCHRLTLHAPRSTLHASGIALVITLILLSVITFMAVTFLVLSRAQRGAVTTTTEQAIAKYAADSAQQQAIADVMAPIIASTNEFNYGLRVSTNYISAAGYTKNNNTVTNVSYNYGSGAAIVGNDALQNLQNLFILPRVPVWVTNRVGGSNELRFYLDLNRNQRFDTNGLLPVMNPLGGFYDLAGNRIGSPTVGNTLSNFFVGDPEWIGVLERPDLPHSATNRFVARYAYMVVPAGKALDINAVHNYAKGAPGKLLDTKMTATVGDGFFRNQGVGPWEMNLAAFLVDLNTNYWPYPSAYLYDTNTAAPNKGIAFDDALSLLRYRYGASQTTPMSLASAGALFPYAPLALHPFNGDFIDGYSHGPLMTGTWWPPAPPMTDRDNARISLPWSGAENTNHFFTTQELFDKTKVSNPLPVSFPDRLLSAGTNIDSYNRYTFYRLVEQMGTDAAVERNKLNLNYVNVDAQGRVVPNMQTNFIPWTPVQFFTNVAIRLLANAGFAAGPVPSPTAAIPTNLLAVSTTAGITVTNLQIPVWPTNFYTPSVHRLLQLAANIYDATTNQGNVYPYYPSVFAPVFTRVGASNVFISGYRSITNAADILTARVLDPSRTGDLVSIKPGIPQVLYGVPLVVGAKKGFPNFNEFLMQTHVRVTRKLEFRRPDSTKLVNETNVMYVLSVTNAYGLEAWNSYQTNYTRNLQCIAVATMMAVVTNTIVTNNMVDPPSPSQPFQWNFTAVYGPTNVSPWTGYYPMRPATSFRIPFAGAFAFFTNHTCFDTNSLFFPEATPFVRHIGTPYFPVPHWWFNLRTRVRFILVDTGTTPNRIVDYVNLDTQEPPLDLTYTLMQDNPGHPIVRTNDNWVPAGQNASYWITNRYPLLTDATHPTQGIMNQWYTSMGQNPPAPGAGTWNDITGQPISGKRNTDQAISNFQIQFQPGNEAFKSNIFYAPFAPTREVYYLTSWQANDPLVHYMIDDLVSLDTANQTNRFQFVAGKQFSSSDILTNIGVAVNDRYAPWPTGSGDALTNYNFMIKDPQLKAGPLQFVGSDSWDFPTNKFANVGWLGRVHRGTPWQTVYLKAGAAEPATWIKWTGNGRSYLNVGQLQTNIAPIYIPNVLATYAPVVDAMLTHPTNDYYILDLFTTSFSDNSARGKMSVNQTSLAAWSALLSGVALLTNSALPGGGFLQTPVIVQPAGVYDPYNANTWPPLVRLVNGINRTRTNIFLNSRGQFDRLGDILKVPELTVNSPFLSFSPTNQAIIRATVLNDATLERLPQQILGLLQDDPAPRFVIYAFGQALKPADRSLVTFGPYFGLCTNYQVVAEAATRAVVRVDGIPKFQPPAPRLLNPATLQFVSLPIIRPALTNLNVVIEQFNVLPPD